MRAHPSGTTGPPGRGSRIGPYRLVRELGRGGMGVVHEAVDTSLDRRVALKVISPRLAGDPAFRARFVREARAQASLDSPHVVPVYAHGEADGALFIVTRLVPGGDLGARLRARGALPPGLAVELVAQVATGLADAHARGLVHRDVKPANVLLEARRDGGSAYLTDFGIAGREDEQPAVRGAAGTPAYLAPELSAGGRPGPAADVYALGCVLWAALTGRPPYAATSDAGLVAAHRSAPVPQLAGLGPWERAANRVLRTALAKRPEQRYPSAAAVRDDLRELGRRWPAPTRVRPASPGRPGRRRRPGVVTAVAAGAALSVMLLVALPGGDPEPGDRDDRRAVATLADALRDDAGLTRTEAECTARALVRRAGVDGLRARGLLDADLAVAGDRDDVDPGALADVLAAAAPCILG